jgi:AraC-like DNA-binding protein
VDEAANTQEPSIGLVSVKLLVPFISVASELGLRVDVALASCGLTNEDLDNADLRVSHALVEQMLRRGIAFSGRRDLGLLAAEHVSPGDFGVVEYAARAQPTLRSAFASMIRNNALLHDGVTIELIIAGDRAILSTEFTGMDGVDAMHEFMLAAQLIVARRLTGMSGLCPLEVHFSHARPASTLVHQRIFRSALRFQQSGCALIFPSALLATQLVTADPGLATVLDRHAANSLQKFDRNMHLPDRVRELVRQNLATGKLSACMLARRLGMSGRTMHRRLVAHGSSYRGIVNDVRRELALHCLRDPNLSAREMARLLGFRTGPAFHRAFRRWTGTTVGESRGELDKARG